MTPLSIRVVHVGSGESSVHLFMESPVHVGRNPLNELILKDPYTSGWHGIVRFDEERAEYVDLGSTNGTEVDGQRAPKNVPVLLTSQTDVRVGAFSLRVERPPEGSVALPAREKTQFGLRAVDLRGLREGTPPAPEAAPAPRAPEPPSSLAARLAEPYAAFREAWSRLYAQAAPLLESMAREERQRELTALLACYPALAQEAQFQALLKDTGLAVPSGNPAPAKATGEGSKSLELLNLFAQTYSPGARALASAEEAEHFLERVAEVLETFGKALVELRKGQEEFGAQMAVRTFSNHTPLRRARTAQEVLGYLLDWTAEGAARLQDLHSSFSDLMIHQVAILSGFREGIRALMGRLGPEQLLGPTRTAAGGGRAGWPARVLPFAAARCWNLAVARYRSLWEEERWAQSVVFGPEFARAYAVIASGTPKGEPSPEEPHPCA